MSQIIENGRDLSNQQQNSLYQARIEELLQENAELKRLLQIKNSQDSHLAQKIKKLTYNEKYNSEISAGKINSLEEQVKSLKKSGDELKIKYDSVLDTKTRVSKENFRLTGRVKELMEELEMLKGDQNRDSPHSENNTKNPGPDTPPIPNSIISTRRNSIADSDITNTTNISTQTKDIYSNTYNKIIKRAKDSRDRTSIDEIKSFHSASMRHQEALVGQASEDRFSRSSAVRWSNRRGSNKPYSFDPRVAPNLGAFGKNRTDSSSFYSSTTPSKVTTRCNSVVSQYGNRDYENVENVGNLSSFQSSKKREIETLVDQVNNSVAAFEKTLGCKTENYNHNTENTEANVDTTSIKFDKFDKSEMAQKQKETDELLKQTAKPKFMSMRDALPKLSGEKDGRKLAIMGGNSKKGRTNSSTRSPNQYQENQNTTDIFSNARNQKPSTIQYSKMVNEIDSNISENEITGEPSIAPIPKPRHSSFMSSFRLKKTKEFEQEFGSKAQLEEKSANNDSKRLSTSSSGFRRGIDGSIMPQIPKISIRRSVRKMKDATKIKLTTCNNQNADDHEETSLDNSSSFVRTSSLMRSTKRASKLLNFNKQKMQEMANEYHTIENSLFDYLKSSGLLAGSVPFTGFQLTINKWNRIEEFSIYKRDPNSENLFKRERYFITHRRKNEYDNKSKELTNILRSQEISKKETSELFIQTKCRIQLPKRFLKKEEYPELEIILGRADIRIEEMIKEAKVNADEDNITKNQLSSMTSEMSENSVFSRSGTQIVRYRSGSTQQERLI